MTTVLVFGAFDGLHPGHAHFLGEARSLGDKLILCLAPDSVIARRKGHAPLYAYAEREAALRLLPIVDDVLPGDDEDGTYNALRVVHPDIIAFGYDQQELHESCVAWLKENHLSSHTVFLHPNEPEKFKSSLLNV